jgi:hypothetical protein
VLAFRRRKKVALGWVEGTQRNKLNGQFKNETHQPIQINMERFF